MSKTSPIKPGSSTSPKEEGPSEMRKATDPLKRSQGGENDDQILREDNVNECDEVVLVPSTKCNDTEIEKIGETNDTNNDESSNPSVPLAIEDKNEPSSTKNEPSCNDDHAAKVDPPADQADVKSSTKNEPSNNDEHAAKGDPPSSQVDGESSTNNEPSCNDEHAAKGDPPADQADGESSTNNEPSCNDEHAAKVDPPASQADGEWTAKQHRAFVLSIFEVGLKNCSPSVIMETMTNNPPFITRERTKSHLQKFRKTREKSKDEFLKEYDAFMQAVQRAATKENDEGKKLSPDEVVSSVLGERSSSDLLGGEAAGILTYSVMNKCNESPEEKPLTYKAVRSSFPTMTAKEKASPLGVALTRIKGLLTFMTDHLLSERLGLSKKKLVDQPQTAQGSINIKRVKSSSSASTDEEQKKPSASRARKHPPHVASDHDVTQGPTLGYPPAHHGGSHSYPFPPQHPPHYPSRLHENSYRNLPHGPSSHPPYAPYYHTQHNPASPRPPSHPYAYPTHHQYPQPPYSSPYAHHPHSEWHRHHPPHPPQHLPSMPHHAPASQLHPQVATSSLPAAPHGYPTHHPNSYNEGYPSSNGGHHYWHGDGRDYSGGSGSALDQSAPNPGNYGSEHRHHESGLQDVHSRDTAYHRSQRYPNDDHRSGPRSSPHMDDQVTTNHRNRSRSLPEREMDSGTIPRRVGEKNEPWISSRRERRGKRSREILTNNDDSNQWAASPYPQDTKSRDNWESPEQRHRRERHSPRAHSRSPRTHSRSPRDHQVSPQHPSQRRKFHRSQPSSASHDSDMFQDSPPLERLSPREDSGSRSYLSFTVGDIRVLTPVHLPSYDGEESKSEEEEEQSETWIPAKFHPTDLDPTAHPNSQSLQRRSGDPVFDGGKDFHNEHRRHQHHHRDNDANRASREKVRSSTIKRYRDESLAPVPNVSTSYNRKSSRNVLY